MKNLITNYQKAFYPYENVSIDKMVIKFKGRWKNKQYNPSKPRKYHIKTFGLCNSATGYAFNILTYFGSDTFYNFNIKRMGQSEKIFEYLLKPLGKVTIFLLIEITTHSLISG